MNVLHIITGLSRGGAEGALLRLIQAPSGDSKHTVISLTNRGVYAETMESFGVPVYAIGMRGVMSVIPALARLIQLLRTLRPDIVQTWMYHADLLGGLASRIAGIPVVWGVRRSEASLQYVGWKTWIVIKICVLFSYVVPYKIVNCSRSSIKLHEKLGYAQRFVYIPNGFNTAGSNALLDKVNRDEFCFGHAARFVDKKGHAEFLSAAEILLNEYPYARFHMAGYGVTEENRDFYQLVPENVKSKLILYGDMSGISLLLSKIDVFVMSSLSEGFPNVVAEAMLASVPCIVSDVGSAAEIVGDTGWVVPPSDLQLLVNAMLAAVNLTHEEIIQQKNSSRSRISECFGIENMRRRYRDVWVDAISGA